MSWYDDDMSFDVAMWGKLALPTKAQAAWREAALDPARYDDWAGDFAPPFRRVAATVAKHLARFAKGDRLTYETKRTTVAVRGLLDEDTFGSECVEIATAFRAAANHGGAGELVFVGLGADISCVVHVAKGKSTFREVPERSEWRAMTELLVRQSRNRFEDTPVGQAMGRSKAAGVKHAAALVVLRAPYDDAALDTLFSALEPRDDFYNPMQEPVTTAMRLLCAANDARVPERALTGLERKWMELAVVTGAVCMHWMELISHYAHQPARPLLTKIDATKSARFDVREVAARTLAALSKR